jgi:type IV pilus assembly protein PilM
MAQTRTATTLTLACEITPSRVIAARGSSSHHGVESASARALAPGAIVPGLTGENVAKPEELRAAIEEVLSVVGSHSKDVIVVVPDSVVRVVLLEFDTLPEKPEEADGVIRFRLKKSLPFDVEKALLSYDVRRTTGGIKVVAAVAQQAVVEQYEAAFRAAGYEPGVVIPSSLAALGAVDADRPTLVLKVDAQTTTVTIVDQDQLLLFRTLEGGAKAVTGERIAEDVYPSLVFLQDNYGLSVERVLLAGVPSVAEIAPVLEQQTGAKVSDLVDSSVAPGTGVPRGELAGVVGALLS